MNDEAMSNLFSSDRDDRCANVVDALFAIADAINNTASALRALGNGNAATEMGAIEAMSMKIFEGQERIATALSGVSEGFSQISDSLDAIATNTARDE